MENLLQYLKGSEKSQGANGNTIYSRLVRKRYCFTINNYSENDVPRIIKFLKSKAYVIGYEKAPSTGTPHLQGYFHYKTSHATLIEKFPLFKRAHIEVAKGSAKQNWDYCTKGGNFVTNVDEKFCIDWDSKNYKKKKPSTVEIMKQRILNQYDGIVWKVWQQKCLDLIEEVSNSSDGARINSIRRKIRWLWERDGNIGKSFLAKYIVCKYPNVCLIEGGGKDIRNQILTLYDSPQFNPDRPLIAIVDIPRVSQGYISYATMEAVLNGCFYSPKYEGGVVVLDKVVMICFANDRPEREKMSEDRWIVVELCGDDLKHQYNAIWNTPQ